MKIRKLSPEAQLRRSKMRIADLEKELAQKDVERALLQGRLTEARRRTLPFGLGRGGDTEMNFLPLFIESAESLSDYVDVHSHGLSEAYPVNRRFVLRVHADMTSPDEPVVLYSRDHSGKKGG